MKVLITGSSGMLGISLCEVLRKDGHKIAGLDVNRPNGLFARPDFFITSDITNFTSLSRAVKDARPDFIIHAAAFTDVDGCELEPDRAESINGLGTRYVAQAAAQTDAILIYVSTDFVFDGHKRAPYIESDTPNPVNVYGRSKLDGEKFAAQIMGDAVFYIIRSSWLFGLGGRNFVDTILKKAQAHKDINVVSDQFASPTYTLDLAGGIRNIMNAARRHKAQSGIYHITNSDDCSWYKLAQKSLRLAHIYGVDLVPIVSLELNRAAERPSMSILDNSRYIKLAGRPLRSWYRALEEYILSRRRGNV